MKPEGRLWWAWLRSEKLLVLSALGLVATSLALRRIPNYTWADGEVLFLLWVLFVVTRGLQRHGLLAHLAARLERGGHLALKLTLLTWGLSMVVTNDVALVAVVPLTMLLHSPAKMGLVILEALAANAGSALSPMGNPQNLFLYWFYQVPVPAFVGTIAPLVGVMALLLSAGAWWLDARFPATAVLPPELPSVGRKGYVYLVGLLIMGLAVLRWVPLWVGWGPLLYAFWADRPTLRVDYALLATFGCFFGFTDNLRVVLAPLLQHPHHVFLLAVLLSQGLSNVPTALLLADFTTRWQALLWGVSVGGFGTLWASLANLIAYRAYQRAQPHTTRAFLGWFHLVSFAALGVGVLLYGLWFVW